MAIHVKPQPQYDLPARRISGSRSEKLEQIAEAIQELLDIKLLECSADQPNVRFLAVPRPRSHWFAMTVTIGLLLIVLVLLLEARPAHAQEAAPSWQAGGFVDAGYLNDLNSPSNHLFRTRGTTPRVDELNVNMAAAYVRKIASATSRWGLEVTGQTGEDSQTFGFSPTAPNVGGADWLRHLGPTNVSYLVPAGRGLTLQGGIFESVIGYDSLYAKDNFTYTRPWAADFTPYFMSGANASYPVSDRLSLTGFLINSYFHLSDPNDVPSFGGQVGYALTARLTFKETTLFGPQQADSSLAYWRSLSDTILEHKSGRLTAAAELQLATERTVATEEHASWLACQLPLHVVVAGPWSVSVRPEFARDTAGRYTGVRQTVGAVASAVEYRRVFPVAQAIVRAEYRYDRSTGQEGGFYSGPANLLVPGQPLVGVAVMLTFDRAWR
jgi:hypothetical protein